MEGFRFANFKSENREPNVRLICTLIKTLSSWLLAKIGRNDLLSIDFQCLD
jgi:hypothetical protein